MVVRLHRLAVLLVGRPAARQRRRVVDHPLLHPHPHPRPGVRQELVLARQIEAVDGLQQTDRARPDHLVDHVPTAVRKLDRQPPHERHAGLGQEVTRVKSPRCARFTSASCSSDGSGFRNALDTTSIHSATGARGQRR